MANILLKKSYLHKILKKLILEIFGILMESLQLCGFLENLLKYLFFKEHIKNLIKSIKVYKINNKILKKIFLK